jgi:inhibitor of KinA
MANYLPYKIFFISDSVATIDFGNVINEEINRKVNALFTHLCQQPLEGMVEVVPAYSSISIYFDIVQIRKKQSMPQKAYQWITNALNELMTGNIEPSREAGNIIRIPVCYEDAYAPDLVRVAQQRKMAPAEIIRLHTGKQYRVYMLGFLPGFAYMGEIDARIEMQRKTEPQPILAGGVGIAGKQTGIYPLNSPGGWQIIGRTPVKLFDKEKDHPCLLTVGDQVSFYSITNDEFRNYQSGSA